MKSFFLVFSFIILCAAVSLASFFAVLSGSLLPVYLLTVLLPVLWYLLRAFIEFFNQPKLSDGSKPNKTFAALIVVFLIFSLLAFYFVIRPKKVKSHGKLKPANTTKKAKSSSFQKPKNKRSKKR